MEITLVALDQFLSILLSLTTMQVLKRIDQKNSKFLLYLRTAYIIALSLNYLYLYIVKRRILQKNDQRKIKMKKDKSPAWFSSADEDEVEGDTEIELSYCEYDMKEYNNVMRSSLLQGVLVSIGHLKWGIVHPMIIQLVAPVKGLFLNPLFLCYLRNKEVVRPFEMNKLFEKVEKPVETKKRKEE